MALFWSMKIGVLVVVFAWSCPYGAREMDPAERVKKCTFV